MRGWQSVLLVGLITALLAGPSAGTARGAELFHDVTLNTHGLERAWFNQALMNKSRAKLVDVLLSNGTLFVLTDMAQVQAFDAENGTPLWDTVVGDPAYLCQPLGANDDLLAVVNGSTVYLLDRKDGRILWSRELDGAAGAGPAISSQHVFVPAVRGKVMAYRYVVEEKLSPEEFRRQLEAEEARSAGMSQTETEIREEFSVAEEEDENELKLERAGRTGLFCQSYGRAMVQPIVTFDKAGQERLAWPTDRGFVFVGEINPVRGDLFLIRYRLNMDAPSASSPVYRPPPPDDPSAPGILYVASQDGYLYALQENEGELLWRYSTGSPIIRSPVLIGKEVYVANQLGGIFCLDADTGEEKWFAPRIVQFVAASETRVYGVNRTHRLVVLDRKSGAYIDELSVVRHPIRYTNSVNDRIYLLTEGGLIQCLHEVGADAPLKHAVEPFTREEEEPQPAATPQPQQEPAEEPPPTTPPVDEENPFFSP